MRRFLLDFSLSRFSHNSPVEVEREKHIKHNYRKITCTIGRSVFPKKSFWHVYNLRKMATLRFRASKFLPKICLWRACEVACEVASSCWIKPMQNKIRGLSSVLKFSSLQKWKKCLFIVISYLTISHRLYACRSLISRFCFFSKPVRPGVQWPKKKLILSISMARWSSRPQL